MHYPYSCRVKPVVHICTIARTCARGQKVRSFSYLFVGFRKTSYPTVQRAIVIIREIAQIPFAQGIQIVANAHISLRMRNRSANPFAIKYTNAYIQRELNIQLLRMCIVYSFIFASHTKIHNYKDKTSIGNYATRKSGNILTRYTNTNTILNNELTEITE